MTPFPAMFAAPECELLLCPQVQLYNKDYLTKHSSQYLTDALCKTVYH